jgi:CDP-diacylglycerol--glycerol-3-phosphate 3-phosphatidyltransferase
VATSFGPSALATPANAITMARLASTPLLLAVVLAAGADGSWLAVAVWFVLSCTDGVDGWLARRHGTTASGAFLDPLADKVVVLGAMAVLVANDVFWWLPVLLIAAREVAVSTYRSWVGRRGISVPARPAAKAKTVVQDLAVGFALLPLTAEGHPFVANGFLWAAVVLTLVTGAQYLADGRRVAVSEV